MDTPCRMIAGDGVIRYPAVSRRIPARNGYVVDIAVIGIAHARTGEAVKPLIVTKDAPFPPRARQALPA